MLALPFATGKNYGVLGLGLSGNATIAALTSNGANLYIWDDDAEVRRQSPHPLTPPTEWPLATLTAIIWSPGVPHTKPQPHPLAVAAKATGVRICCDIELLLQANALQAQPAKVIAITGTNGKSTTTALIGHVLQSAGLSVAVGGNLGIPALALPTLGANGWYVLETSSYQLELIQSRHFDIGVLLNITPDHLDRHGDMAGYIAAKALIANPAHPQTLVVGLDTPPTATLARQWQQHPHLRVQTISTQPAADADYSSHSGQLWRNGKAAFAFGPTAALPNLLGCHNQENALAALAVATAAGLTPAASWAGLQTFPGLAHRQQVVRALPALRFVNDSKATNADAAAKALACYENIFWIAGGLPKAGGLDGLDEYMPRIRHAYLIGQAAPEFAQWLAARQVPHDIVHTLAAAVPIAANAAATSGLADATVLLSPACASWDQFKNFGERGETFAALAQAWQPSTIV